MRRINPICLSVAPPGLTLFCCLLHGPSGPTRGRGRGRGGRSGLFLFEGVGDDVFEFGDVIGEALFADGGEFAPGMGAVVLEGFFDFDEAGFLQDGEVAAEVAVGEGAEVLEVAEDEAGGVGGEGGDDAESGLFVDDAVDAVVGVAAAFGLVFGVFSGHENVPIGNRG